MPQFNERGAGLLIYMMLVAVVSALFFASVQAYMINLERTKLALQIYDEKIQLNNELKIILANQELCNGTIHISGTKFSVQSGKTIYFKADTIYQKYLKFKDLRLENIDTHKDGSKSADFVIFFTHVSNRLLDKIKVKAGFHEIGGSLSQCRLYIEPQAVCEEAGGTWNPTLFFCDLCSRIKGSWVGGAPGSGSCTVFRY